MRNIISRENFLIVEAASLKHILSNIVPYGYDMKERVLAFYRIAIDLERSKEPDIREYYEYPINFKNDSLILVDLPCNKKFCNQFDNNRSPRETRWPKDLYVGLVVIIDRIPYHLLNMVISYEDVKAIDISRELLPIRISDFEVNGKEAERLELVPEKVESINHNIKSNPSLKGMLELLRKEISDNVVIPSKLYLSLNSKSIELAQIYSELNSKRLADSLSSGHLLDSFLSYAPLNNLIDNVDADQLITISELDDSQRVAVTEALNSRVSVITGPPGTGKTQVIENVLANAFIMGKKVLVASKNNKAVDNIKDRFDTVDPTGYFVRFGSKRYVTENTLPAINRLLTTISTINNSTNDYDTLALLYEQSVKDIKEAKVTLARRNALKQEMPNLLAEQKHIQQSLLIYAQVHQHSLDTIDKEYGSIKDLKNISAEDLNLYLSKIKILKSKTLAKLSGILGPWYRMFYKKKLAARLLKETLTSPSLLKNHFVKLDLKSDVSQFNITDDFECYCNTIIRFVEEALLMHKKIDIENARYNDHKSGPERRLSALLRDIPVKQKDLEKLNALEASLNDRISRRKKWLEDNGQKLLHSYIYHYIAERQASRIVHDYKAYIPDNIPWKNIDYTDFVRKTKYFIDVVRLCTVTSLSVKNAFPLCDDLFDMVVIDEASQCDIASAIPLIMRAKQLVVIGDPMQLQHISTITDDEENEIKRYLGLDGKMYVRYAKQSLWDYCQSFISNSKTGMRVPCMLQNHYRCFPDIINYSNEIFYKSRLGHRLIVKTNVDKLKVNPQGIVLVDVKGVQESHNMNINIQEVRKSIELAVNSACQFPNATIGIVTPFRHQAEKINTFIPDKFADRIEANTVHKYQGDEKDIMIYSLVVTDNSPDCKIKWIDDTVPNLVNVAITRARSTLYVVCNVDYIKAHSSACKPLGYLVRYK